MFEFFDKLNALGPIIVYLSVSLRIFSKVYHTSENVIDELFHVPQGMQYCAANFTYWDPKITTLPGLYIATYAFMKPFFGCTLFSLRMTNLIASCVNLYLFSSLIRKFQRSDRYTEKILMQAVNLALLPPLYFFSHVYYTDTLSLTFVLLFLRVYISDGYYIFLTLFGIFSIIMRQTNVVWIALCLGHTIIDLVMNSYLEQNELESNEYDIQDGVQATMFHIRTKFIHIFKYITFDQFVKISSMVTILLGFLAFVYINGSIVVGDKSAHTASIHVPQLFYFLLFYGVFSFPYVMRNLYAVVYESFQKKPLIFISIASFIVIVHFNTLIHPYLLADNRHYTFYVWNKFFGKYWFAKYSIVPTYVLLTISLYRNLDSSINFGFLLPYSVCLFAAVALQKMIEVRYFFIPFVLLKMQFYKPSWTVIWSDFIINIIINYVTLNIFFNKEIIWDDFDDVQRLIW